MKKLTFGKGRNSSKGFYVALAVCVAAIGGATYLTLNQLNQPIPQDYPSTTLDNTTEWSIPETDAVEKSQPGVPKDTSQVIIREPSSSQATESLPSSETSQPASVPTIKNPEPSGDVGAFIMPVTGEISNPYSGGELVKSKTLKEWRTHDGVDILAKEGTPVKSLNDGKVTDIREDSKWGVTVEIEYPGGITAIFSGLNDDVKVKKGQEVKLGDVIGSVGNTTLVEAAEESHLHLGMKRDGEWVDPMSVITKN